MSYDDDMLSCRARSYVSRLYVCTKWTMWTNEEIIMDRGDGGDSHHTQCTYAQQMPRHWDAWNRWLASRFRRVPWKSVAAVEPFNRSVWLAIHIFVLNPLERQFECASLKNILNWYTCECKYICTYSWFKIKYRICVGIASSQLLIEHKII